MDSPRTLTNTKPRAIPTSSRRAHAPSSACLSRCTCANLGELAPTRTCILIPQSARDALNEEVVDKEVMNRLCVSAVGVHPLPCSEEATFWREIVEVFPRIIDFLCSPEPNLGQVRRPSNSFFEMWSNRQIRLDELFFVLRQAELLKGLDR